MPSELRGPDVRIRYRLIDIRELDGDVLLASPDLGDNVLALLTRLRDHTEAVRSIMAKLEGRPEGERVAAVQQLLILAGLRGLEQLVREEVEKMPLEIDLMENKVLGPAIRQGREEGLQRGLEQGLQRGHAEGELRLLQLLVEKRFGAISASVSTRLAALSQAEIESLARRILDVDTLDQLLS